MPRQGESAAPGQFQPTSPRAPQRLQEGARRICAGRASPPEWVPGIPRLKPPPRQEVPFWSRVGNNGVQRRQGVEPHDGLGGHFLGDGQKPGQTSVRKRAASEKSARQT